MNRPIWVTDFRRRFRALLADRRGVEAIEFAFIAPILIVITVGTLEIGLMVFDYHRASEATRRGARTAIVNEPIASMDDLKSGTIRCEGEADDTISCGDSEMFGEATFPAIVTTMQNILPNVTGENVDILYSPSGVGGDADTAGIVTPLVTVSLVGYKHKFALLDLIPGIPEAVTFPPFTTTLVAPSTAVAVDP